MKPDLTQSGLGSLAHAVRNIMSGKATRIDLGHNTIVYKMPSGNSKRYTVRVDMEVEEED